jgi:hypothetical protein
MCRTLTSKKRMVCFVAMLSLLMMIWEFSGAFMIKLNMSEWQNPQDTTSNDSEIG